MTVKGHHHPVLKVRNFKIFELSNRYFNLSCWPLNKPLPFVKRANIVLKESKESLRPQFDHSLTRTWLAWPRCMFGGLRPYKCIWGKSCWRTYLRTDNRSSLLDVEIWSAQGLFLKTSIYFHVCRSFPERLVQVMKVGIFTWFFFFPSSSAPFLQYFPGYFWRTMMQVSESTVQVLHNFSSSLWLVAWCLVNR